MRGRLLVAAILALALILRLGLALLHDPGPAAGDARDFANHAAALADRGSYPESEIAPRGGPTAFRPPGYPLALAAVYAVAGRGDAPRVAGAVLGTLAVALLGLVALRLFGARPAVAAMVLAAVFPPLIMVSVATLAEGLLIALVLGALACALELRRAPDRLALLLGAGVLAGAAALTRTNGIVVLLPLLLAVPRRRRLVLALVTLAVVTPWIVRSSTALDTFVPATTQAGFTLAGTYNEVARTDPEYPAAWRRPIMAPYDELREGSRRNEAGLERAFRSEALAYAADHPLYPPVVVFQATVRMLNLADPEVERLSAEREAGVPPWFLTANRWAVWLLVALAVAGALTRAARAAPRWLWLFPLLLWLSVAIAIGATRYRTPVDPFLILLAALAVVRWRPA